MGLFGIATNSVQMLVLVAVLTVAVLLFCILKNSCYEANEGIRIYLQRQQKVMD